MHRMSSKKCFAPECFHRHAFVWLTPDETLSIGQDGEILNDWIKNGRPVIVRRPCLSPDGKHFCAGLALPPAPQKRRLAFELPLALVREVAEPPLWEDCGAAVNPTVVAVRAAAEAAGVRLRTYGSHAWQHLTGLPYLTGDSDIDIIAFVTTRQSWDLIRQRLEEVVWESAPRIDLEIVLCGDTSFQWREFADASRRLIFKGNTQVWLGNKSEVAGYLAE